MAGTFNLPAAASFGAFNGRCGGRTKLGSAAALLVRFTGLDGLAPHLWRAVWQLSGQPFELNRTNIMERRMTPHRVVEAVDVTADGLPGLSSGLEDGAPDQLGF
jgi:hypothetical protein